MVAKSTDRSAFEQVGSTGRSKWGPTILIGDNKFTGSNGAREYYAMLRDPTAMLLHMALAMPIRTVKWHVNPSSESQADVDAAQFAWEALNDIQGGWLGLLSNIESMFWAGWAMFDMQLSRRDDGRVGFEAIGFRPQQTLSDWEYDENGKIIGMKQSTPTGGMALIELSRGLLFRTTLEGDNPEGRSIFYAAHRPYLFKRRLEQTEGVGLFRRWRGFPTITLPANASTRVDTPEGGSDEEKAEALVQAIYRDDAMGAILKAGWLLDFGGPEGNIDATMGETIMRKDMEMARATLAQYLLLGLKSVGTNALAETLEKSFELVLDAYLNQIADEFNRYCIPYLFDNNTFSGLSGLPQLAHAPARTLELNKIAEFIDSLTKSGISVSDTPTENFLRSLVPGMPPASEVDQQPSDDDDEDPEPPSENSTNVVYRATFAVALTSDGGIDEDALRELTDANREAQKETISDFQNDFGSAIVDLGSGATEAGVRVLLSSMITDALGAFRDRAVEDISAAFWMGYGKTGGPEVLPQLQREIQLSDAWMGYGSGGRLAHVNPEGKPTLFGDLFDKLNLQIVTIVALLATGRREEVLGLIDDAVRAAGGANRGGLYSGNVWHAGYAGAVQRARVDTTTRVRWRLDPLAEHCPTCRRFGGRTYNSMNEMLAFTGNILPGYGTECDGNCRCHLDALRGGVWVSL